MIWSNLSWYGLDLNSKIMNHFTNLDNFVFLINSWIFIFQNWRIVTLDELILKCRTVYAALDMIWSLTSIGDALGMNHHSAFNDLSSKIRFFPLKCNIITSKRVCAASTTLFQNVLNNRYILAYFQKRWNTFCKEKLCWHTIIVCCCFL